MTIVVLWFIDPLTREVEPTKIPGVTKQLMLATLVRLWCGSSLATLGNNDIPNGGRQLYCEAALAGVQYWIQLLEYIATVLGTLAVYLLLLV